MPASNKSTDGLPAKGTVYSVPHPRAFTSNSLILLHESYDAAAKAGPNFLELLADSEKGTGFLTDIFSTISKARTEETDSPWPRRRDFFAVVNSVTGNAEESLVAQQSYFHAHVVVGDYNDPFVKAVRETQSYGQGEPDYFFMQAVGDHKRTQHILANPVLRFEYEKASPEDKFEELVSKYERAGKTGTEAAEQALADSSLWAHAVSDYKSALRLDRFADLDDAKGNVEVFTPLEPFRLAPYHRMIVVHAGNLENMLKSEETLARLRGVLLEYMPGPSGRTGARLVMDTFNYNDRISDPDDFTWNDDSGVVLHMLGDFKEEPVTDGKGKVAQRRWFEPPAP